MRAVINPRAMFAVGVSLLALLQALPSLAQVATSPAAPETTADTPADDTGDIVVAGFRSSLQQALNIKRTEAGAVAIPAEDIARPDDRKWVI